MVLLLLYAAEDGKKYICFWLWANLCEHLFVGVGGHVIGKSDGLVPLMSLDGEVPDV